MLESHWAELKATANRQNRSVYQLSALLALSSIERLPENLRLLSRSTSRAVWMTGGMVAGALFDHYRNALEDISRHGYMDYWRRSFRPYLQAAARQFSPKRTSLTQRLLNR